MSAKALPPLVVLVVLVLVLVAMVVVPVLLLQPPAPPPPRPLHRSQRAHTTLALGLEDVSPVFC